MLVFEVSGKNGEFDDPDAFIRRCIYCSFYQGGIEPLYSTYHSDDKLIAAAKLSKIIIGAMILPIEAAPDFRRAILHI